MATYEEWNDALLDYVTAGRPQGERIYITIDAEALEYIAEKLETTVGDFARAIQERCVANNRVHLRKIQPGVLRDYATAPSYFAFLCAMVLAAYRMGDDEDEGISSNNYFVHLNSILGLPLYNGRPDGMEGGTEVAFWNDWAAWLQFHGYRHTATVDGTHYYKYALSQALIRQADHDNLWQHFSTNSHRYPDRLSRDDLIRSLRADTRRDSFLLTRHLRQLLESDGIIGMQRYDDLAEAVHDVFISWIENGKPSQRIKGVVRPAHHHILGAGLYRVENPISRKVDYYILPKQPRHEQVGRLTILCEGEEEELIFDRPGWYEPLSSPLTLNELNTDIRILINGHARINALVLPERDFWILVPDPDNALSGIYATWDDRPELGTTFVLLIKAQMQQDLDILYAAGLVQWQPETPRSLENDWLEYVGIMVVSNAWAGVDIEHRELLAQLRPRSMVGISLHGGLQDTHRSAWLVGHAPTLTVTSFQDEIEVELLDLHTNSICLSQSNVKSGELVELNALRSGDYLIRITVDHQVRERLLRLVDWDDLAIKHADHKAPLMLGEVQLFGALLR